MERTYFGIPLTHFAMIGSSHPLNYGDRVGDVPGFRPGQF